MSLVHQVEQLLLAFRGVFKRQRAFGWFVLVLWALMLRMEAAGVTSIVRCLGLAPCEYFNLLHFFHSAAFQVKDLCRTWKAVVKQNAEAVCIQGSPLFILDAIKVGKAGKKMPGVRLLHQESEDNSKPEYIMGHFFGAVCAAVQAGGHVFAIPLRLQIQDGVKRSPSDAATLVDKMQRLAGEVLERGSTVVADAYYASHTLLADLLKNGISYIGRVRINTVAYLPPPMGPHPRRKGRPRTRGEKVTLRDLFSRLSLFTWIRLDLYGEVKEIGYHMIDLYWQGLYVRFVLTIYPNGKKVILISTNTAFCVESIIRAYELRFKIEVTFKTLVHVLFAFCYHFWMKAMKKMEDGTKNLYLHRASESFRRQVYRKIEAYERFVNIAAIGLGLLQLLAIKYPAQIWQRFPVWLRTLPKHGCPSEHVVRLTLQHELHQICLKSPDSTMLEKFLAQRQTVSSPAHPMRLTA